MSLHLAGQRRLFIGATEHHGLFYAVEPVVDGVGEVVLPKGVVMIARLGRYR
jgi:hypothetical protein